MELQPWPGSEPVLTCERELGDGDRRKLTRLATALGLVAQVTEIRARRQRTRLGHVSSSRSPTGPHAGPGVTSITGDTTTHSQLGLRPFPRTGCVLHAPQTV